MKKIVPLEDLLAPVVFVMSMIGAGGVWSHYTRLPLWLTITLGVVTGWLAVVGLLLFLGTVTKRKR